MTRAALTIDQRDKILKVRQRLVDAGLPALGKYVGSALILRTSPSQLIGWLEGAIAIIKSEYDID